MALESAALDSGPKRVALIIDASRNIPDDQWNLESEMAASLLERARVNDKVVLLLIESDGATGSFLSPHEADEQIRKLVFSRPLASDSDERVYDTLLAAANLLVPPQFGDAVFLFGHPQDLGSKTDPDQLQELILKNKFRFCGISFSDPLSGKMPPGLDLNKPLPPDLLALVSPKLAKMTAATGYFFSYHSVLALNQPGQLGLFKGFLSDLYAGIAEPYRLKIQTPGAINPIKLTVALPGRDVKSTKLNYPETIYPCVSAPAMH